MSLDEFSMWFERDGLRSAVKRTRREQLEAIRDYIADQLEANLCHVCANSRLRTGDQASLIQKLKDTLAELADIEAQEDPENVLEGIRGLLSAPEVTEETQTRRSGSRRPGAGRHS